MATTISKLAAVLTGGLDPSFVQTMKTGNAQVAGLKQGVKQANGEMEGASGPKSFKDSLKSLNEQFGRSSGLGQFGKLLKGGGALFAINLVTKELDAASGEAAKLVGQFREGKITSGELADQLARQIPILGHIYSTGRNIHDIITGDAQVIEQMKSDQQQFDDALEAGEAISKTMRDNFEKTSDFIRRMKTEIRSLFGFKTPPGEELSLRLVETKKQLDETMKGFDEDVKKGFGKGTEFAKQFGNQGINSVEQMKGRVAGLKAIIAQQLPAAVGVQHFKSGGLFTPVKEWSIAKNQEEIDAAIAARKKASDELAKINSDQVFAKSLAGQLDAKVGKVISDLSAGGLFAAQWTKIGADSGAAYVAGIAKKINTEDKKLGLFRQTNPLKLINDAAHQTLSLFDRIGDKLDIIKGKLGITGNKLLLAAFPIAAWFEDRKSKSEFGWDDSHRLAPLAERGSADAARLQAMALSRATSSADPQKQVANNTKQTADNTKVAADALSAMAKRPSQLLAVVSF